MGFTEFSCNCLDNIPFQRYRHDSAILMGIHQVLTGTWVQGSLRIDDLLPYLLRTKCLKAILNLLLLLQISFLITDLSHNSFYWLSSLSLTKVLHFITEDSEILLICSSRRNQNHKPHREIVFHKLELWYIQPQFSRRELPLWQLQKKKKAQLMLLEQDTGQLSRLISAVGPIK